VIILSSYHCLQLLLRSYSSFGIDRTNVYYKSIESLKISVELFLLLVKWTLVVGDRARLLLFVVDCRRMGNCVPDRQPYTLRRRHVLRHLRVGRETAVGRSTGRRRRRNTAGRQESPGASVTPASRCGRRRRRRRGPCLSPGRDVVVWGDDWPRRAVPDQDGDGTDTDCTARWHLPERFRQRTQPVGYGSRVSSLRCSVCGRW